MRSANQAAVVVVDGVDEQRALAVVDDVEVGFSSTSRRAA